MAIGDRVAGRTPAAQYSRQQAAPRAFGAGVSTALESLSNATSNLSLSYEDIAAKVSERQDSEVAFDAENRYISYIGQENRAQAERIRGASESAAGVTENTQEAISKSSESFIASLPPTLQNEYRNKLSTFRENAVTSAFNYEYVAGNEKFVKDVTVTMNSEASEVLLGNKSAEEAFSNVTGLIGRSDLDEAAQRDLTDQAQAFLLKAEFQKEVEYAKDFRGTVEPRSEGDVVAAGLLPHERGILNAISLPESSDRYDVMYGGGKITDFSDHPRKYITITSGPNKGQKSSAAGKYQFLASTWDSTVNSYNAENPQAKITDFSPESQDRIAIYHARKIYNRQLGAGEKNFDQVLNSGDRELIKSMKRALWDDNGGWEGFRRMTGDAFANVIMGSQGIAGGGTGTPQDPDIWNNPRYSSLTFDQKNTLANAADTSSRKRDEAAAQITLAQQKATTEQTMLSAIAGEHKLADMNQLIQQGRLPDSASVTKWQGLVEKAAKGQADRDRITSALKNGSPLFSEDDNGLNLLLGDSGTEAIRGKDAAYAQNILLPIAQQAGFFPSDSAKLLSDMVRSSDPAAREYATSVLSTAASADPRILDRSPGLSESAKKQVILTNQLRGLYTPEEVAERLREVNDPRQQAALEGARVSARKLFSDNYSTEDVLSAFDTWAPGDAPDAPISVAQGESLRQDYQTAFTEGFLISGDEGKANEYAAELIKKHWSPTRIGGGIRLTKFPPEVFYPTVNGSHDWVEAQARNELGFSADVDFQLLPDAQTEHEGKAYLSSEDKTGLPYASYQVTFLNEQGYPDVMRGEDGQPLRWSGEISTEMRTRIAGAAQFSQLEAERDRLDNSSAYGPLTDADRSRKTEVEAQLEELTANDSFNDPIRVVPEDLKADVEDKRAKLVERRDAAIAGGQPGSRQILAPRLQKQIDLLDKKLELY